MKPIRLTLLSMVTMVNLSVSVLAGEGQKILDVNEMLRWQSDQDSSYEVRPGISLFLSKDEVLFRGGCGVSGKLAISDIVQLERASLIDACGNREGNNFAMLIYHGDSKRQDIVVLLPDGIKKVSSDKVPMRVIFSKLFSLSKTGRYVLVEVGVYRNRGIDEFDVIYDPRVVDVVDGDILPNGGVDAWAEFRDQ